MILAMMDNDFFKGYQVDRSEAIFISHL